MHLYTIFVSIHIFPLIHFITECLTCEHLHLTSREDLRLGGAPGAIPAIGPGAGIAVENLDL